MACTAKIDNKICPTCRTPITSKLQSAVITSAIRKIKEYEKVPFEEVNFKPEEEKKEEIKEDINSDYETQSTDTNYDVSTTSGLIFFNIEFLELYTDSRGRRIIYQNGQFVGFSRQDFIRATLDICGVNVSIIQRLS